MEVNKLNETDKTITVGWTPPAGQEGVVGIIDGSELLADGKRHFSGSKTLSSIKFAKLLDGKEHDYGVNVLGAIDHGSVMSGNNPVPASYPIPPQGALTLHDGGYASQSGIFSRDPGAVEITGGHYTRYTGYGVAQMAWNGKAVQSTAQSKIHDLMVDYIKAASSMNGTGEACLWLGNWTHAYDIVLNMGQWMNLWTGAACWNSLIEDILFKQTPGVQCYIEHQTIGATFRRIVMEENPGGTNPYNIEWAYGGACSHHNTITQQKIYVPANRWLFFDAGTYGNKLSELTLYGPGNGIAMPANLVDSNQPNQIDWSTIDTTNLAGVKYKVHNNAIGAQHAPLAEHMLEPGTIRMPTPLHERLTMMQSLH